MINTISKQLTTKQHTKNKTANKKPRKHQQTRNHSNHNPKTHLKQVKPQTKQH